MSEEKSPCVDCDIRKWYARKLDIHFSDEDCYYVCEKYELWKKAKKDAEKGVKKHD